MNRITSLVLLVLAAAAAAALASAPEPDRPIQHPLVISPASQNVAGGNSVQLTIGFAVPSDGDVTVSLSTNESGAFVDLPSSVVVADGTYSTTITVQTYTVLSQLTATVTGTATGHPSAQGVVVVQP